MKEKGKFLEVWKLDAARRQMETAAILYFNDGDPVSIHTLVSAAYEILSNLEAKKGKKMWIESSLSNTFGAELSKEIRPYMRKPQNFFKHANKRRETKIRFSPVLTEIMLLDVERAYLELTGAQSLILRAYEKWCYIQYPEVFSPTPEDQNILSDLRNKLGTLSRQQFLSEFLKLAVVMRS